MSCKEGGGGLEVVAGTAVAGVVIECFFLQSSHVDLCITRPLPRRIPGTPSGCRRRCSQRKSAPSSTQATA